MNTENKKNIITLEQVLGCTIKYEVRSPSISRDKPSLEINSTKIHSWLTNYLNVKHGSIFSTGIDVSKLLQYKDGTISSMIKGVKGFEGHSGFEKLDIADMANDILYQISFLFNKEITSSFESFVTQTNTEINNIYNYLNLQDFAKLRSISYFLQEIYTDLHIVGLNKEQIIATLGNVQRNKIDLREFLFKYLELIKANVSPNNLLGPNINELANNYLNCRFCISLYTISMVIEVILANRYDDIGLKDLKNKVQNILEEFNSLTNLVTNSLKTRFYNNQQQINNSIFWCFDQLSQQRQFENQNLSNFANQHLSYFNSNLELEKVEEMLVRRNKLLANIIIKPSEQS